MNDSKTTDKQLRILQVNKYYHPYLGGIERVVRQLAEGLAQKTEMTVLVSAEDTKHHVETINGVSVHRVPRQTKFGNMPVSFGMLSKFRALSKQADVIHLHMPFPLGDLACLLSGYKGKVVLWWHSDVVRQKKMMFFYKPIMLKMLKRADAIIVATQGHIDGSSYLKAFESKCRIIPYGVEPAIRSASDIYINKKISLPVSTAPEGPVRFLFVGRFTYYKGCDVLLEAFAKVTGAELVIVGSGKSENQLRQKAIALGINNRIYFTGKLSDAELLQAYEECDVFVLPSIAKSEAFGLVQIEAMAFGKPVINTALSSGVPHVSINGETGLTVASQNVEEMAKAMQWMVDHPDKRQQFGKNARNRVKSVYRIEDMLDRVLDLYHELIQGDYQK